MDIAATNPAALSLAVSIQQTQSGELQAEKREIVQAVHALNKAESFGPHKELTFSLDRETKRPVLKIVDRKSGEVVTQIPSEQVLRLAKQLAGK